MRRLLAAAAVVAAACSPGEPRRAELPEAQGPPAVRPAVVARHAASFDGEMARRVAGSQQEFAAATYITGHLQQAGYRVRLESVPVDDLVRSTDVIASRGTDPEAIVAIPYDTTRLAPPQGEDLGLFLEVARALAVADPGHRVWFVALGAEHAEVSGGNLGSRRLLQLLQDEGVTPSVVTPAVVPGGGFAAPGPPGDGLRAVAQEMGVPAARPFTDPMLPSLLELTKVFGAADLDHAIAAGGVEEAGAVLLRYLGDL